MQRLTTIAAGCPSLQVRARLLSAFCIYRNVQMLNISIVHPVLGKLGSIFTSVSWNRAVIYVTELCDSWTAAAARWSAIPAPSGKRKNYRLRFLPLPEYSDR
jgi:outer membrane phospholipase A